MTVDDYTGRRILEAMHEAVRYPGRWRGNRKVWPAGATSIWNLAPATVRFYGCSVPPEKMSIVSKSTKPFARLIFMMRVCRVFGNIREVESGSYDFIYSVNVLEHIPDLVAEIAELKRVLRPAAGCSYSVPAFRALWTSIDTEVGHVTRFTGCRWARPCATAGFHVRDVLL